MNNKKKIVKLKEENLINIVKKIVQEQSMSDGFKPFPEKKEPEPVEEPQQQQQQVKYGTPEAILKGKRIVRSSLEKAMKSMEQLTAMTGINTDTNDVVPDIKKALENFENLFGDPQPKENDDE